MNQQPKHYKSLIDPIQLSINLKLDFLSGNVIKYIFRFNKKGSLIRDLEKAKHYLRLAYINEMFINIEMGTDEINECISEFMEKNEFTNMQNEFYHAFFGMLLTEYQYLRDRLYDDCNSIIESFIRHYETNDLENKLHGEPSYD